MAFPDDAGERPMWKTALLFFSLVGVLVFANWGSPGDSQGFWHWVWNNQWVITSVFAMLFTLALIFVLRMKFRNVIVSVFAVTISALLSPGIPEIPFAVGFIALSLIAWAEKGEPREWLWSTWSFTRQIVPLLFAGVFVAGLLLGAPGTEGQGIIPGHWVAGLVGGNSLAANLFASLFGALMYFATLTEVPIIEGLMHSGMGKGPALALLLAGPAISLPNMLVIHSVLGTRKTAVFILLVVIMATVSGLVYGTLF